jgi:hypothetical protein
MHRHLVWKLLICSIVMGSTAGASGRAMDCASRLAGVKTISDIGLNYEGGDALDGFVADGTKSNACLLSLLVDRRLRPNPFDSKLISLVTNSEVALTVLAKVNGFSPDECFPKSFRERRIIGESDFHAWFLNKRNVESMASRCTALVASGHYKTRWHQVTIPAWPASACISRLKEAESVSQIKTLYSNMSPADFDCIVSAVDSTELTNAPPGASQVRVVPVGDLAILALMVSPYSADVRACGGVAASGESLPPELENKLRYEPERTAFQKCVASRKAHP